MEGVHLGEAAVLGLLVVVLLVAAPEEGIRVTGEALELCGSGGTCPAVMCAADEVAVEMFLHHDLGFMDIPELVSHTLKQHKVTKNPSLEEILAHAREVGFRTVLNTKGIGLERRPDVTRFTDVLVLGLDSLAGWAHQCSIP
jgi:hypothetical protein